MLRPFFRCDRPDPDRDRDTGAGRRSRRRTPRRRPSPAAARGSWRRSTATGCSTSRARPTRWATSKGPCSSDDIRELVRFLFDVKAKEVKVEVAGIKLLDPKRAIVGIAATQKKYVPERFSEELRGVADGCGHGRPGHHRGQLHPRDVPLLGVRPVAARRRRTARSTTAGSSTTAATGGSRSTPC